MSWFNYIGVIMISVILIPNMLYSIKHKDSFANVGIKKSVIIIEQIARFGCILFLMFNIPMTYFNFWFPHARLIYIIVNCAFICIYLLSWMIHWKRKTTRAAFLSITPSFIFIFSGVMILSIPLIVFSILFAVSHVYISLKNAKE